MVMTEAVVLLADLRSRGVQLETDGSRLRWRPAALVTATEAEQIKSHKGEIIASLVGSAVVVRCPSCRHPLDSKRRCWQCCNRLCACGRQTGSAFIELCLLCESRVYAENQSCPT